MAWIVLLVPFVPFVPFVLPALLARTAIAQAPPPVSAPTSTPTPAPMPTPAPSLQPVVRAAMGLALYGAVAHAPELGASAAGAGAGVFVRDERFALAFDVAVLSPVEIGLRARPALDGHVELLRVPLCLTSSYLVHLGDFSLGPVLGIAFDLLHARGVDLARSESQLRLSVGGLLGLEAHADLGSRLGLVLRAGLRGFVRRYRLVVEPLGSVAQTPAAWLGAELGMEWRLL